MSEWKPTKEQIEVAARADGYRLIAVQGWCSPDGCFIAESELPDYPNDHNAMQRLIDGLDDDEIKQYVSHLRGAVHVNDMVSVQDLITIARAICSRKFRAWCRAKDIEQLKEDE